MTDTTSNRRQRVHRSGALGMVLAAAAEKDLTAAKPGAREVASVEASQQPQRSPQKFYPAKGFGKVPASVCRPWRLADRPIDEFGYSASLAKSIEANGQVQPALVRLCHDEAAPEIRYEVIAGVARWRSMLAVDGELDVQIRELTDIQAYRAMVAENEDRQNLSDYARALRFARALDEGLVSSKTELAELAKLPASQLSYFLGFASLPATVVSALSDIKAIPVRLGYALSVAVQYGFEEAVVRDIAKIESGEIRRDEIPGVWLAKPPSQKEGATTSVVGVEAPVGLTGVPQVSRLLGRSGVVLGQLKRATNGGVTLKISPAIGRKLTPQTIEEISALLEPLVNR